MNARLRHKTLTPKPEVRLTEKICLAAWQRERVLMFHRLFERAELKQQSGQSHRRTFRHFMRCRNGKNFRTCPARKIQFSLVSLFRLHRQWLASGRTPAAVLPRYLAGPNLPPSVFRRFAKFSGRQSWRGMQAAFEAFTARRPLPIRYRRFCRWFPVQLFRELQSKLAAVEFAQRDLADYRLKLDAWVLANLPEKPKRKRRSGAELSREGAQL